MSHVHQQKTELPITKKKFKVFMETTESKYIILEAESAEEAERMADEDDHDESWSYCDGTFDAFINTGDTEEIKDN